MSYEIANVLEEHEQSKALLVKISETQLLSALVVLVLELSLLFGKLFLEKILQERAEEKTQWSHCKKCGKKLHSKGKFDRQMRTVLGEVHWDRRVGRCPNGCAIGQVVPFDEILGISPHQKSSRELMEFGCLLSIFVPYGIASQLLFHLWGISIDPQSIWNWAQFFGQKAMEQLESQLADFHAGKSICPETMADSIATLRTLMGSDGVLVPFRPNGGKPHGKAVFHEIKIGVITRTKEKITKTGKQVRSLVQRRVVAVLGNSEQLAQRLQMEAHLQRIQDSQQVVWLSDGGKWLWKIVKTYFPTIVPVLDFYHAAQNLYKAAKGYLDGRTQACKIWFERTRHQLRHGEEAELINEIKETIDKQKPTQDVAALEAFIEYIGNHENHIQYQDLKNSGIPIGSGFIESACKWLIQQRFKGTGMRWSKEGFNHLLHLRLLWVNGRWNSFFQTPFQASPSC